MAGGVDGVWIDWKYNARPEERGVILAEWWLRRSIFMWLSLLTGLSLSKGVPACTLAGVFFNSALQAVPRVHLVLAH